MIRDHDVSQLTTAELEHAKRELQANLGMITFHSPAHVPIQPQQRAIDSELAERAESQQVTGRAAVPAGTGLHLGQQGQDSLRDRAASGGRELRGMAARMGLPHY